MSKLIWEKESCPEEQVVSVSTRVPFKKTIEITRMNDFTEPMSLTLTYNSPVCGCESQEVIVYCSKEEFKEIAKKMIEMADENE